MEKNKKKKRNVLQNSSRCERERERARTIRHFGNIKGETRGEARRDAERAKFEKKKTGASRIESLMLKRDMITKFLITHN